MLTLIDYYLPGFNAGGPLRTVANMVDRLGDRLAFAPDLLTRRPGPFGPRRVKRPGALRVVFVSRISPMENLDEAIRLLAGIKGRVDLHRAASLAQACRARYFTDDAERLFADPRIVVQTFDQSRLELAPAMDRVA